MFVAVDGNSKRVCAQLTEHSFLQVAKYELAQGAFGWVKYLSFFQDYFASFLDNVVRCHAVFCGLDFDLGRVSPGERNSKLRYFVGAKKHAILLDPICIQV